MTMISCRRRIHIPAGPLEQIRLNLHIRPLSIVIYIYLRSGFSDLCRGIDGGTETALNPLQTG